MAVKIDQDHLYYGAAVIQIAEHPSFTAINDFKISGTPVRCAYWVNVDIGVYLKYRTKADRQADWNGKNANEYLFVFNKDARRHLENMAKRSPKVFLGLVCVEDKQICCLSIDKFRQLIQRRKHEKGADEDQYTVVVALPRGSKFRVYVTPPRRRNTTLGDPILIAQRDFPNKVFH